jgi:restriction endonuclease S subunit
MSARQFIVRRSAIETRWDPFYFQPHLVALEARVRAKTQRTLRDYTLHMAGGSTPLKSEGGKHYAPAESGVPFIRVQNLTTTGELDLEDVKYITESTHSTLLERSRLTGGELLVKITGVGRMAVAAVVPAGVDANINQHIAAIRTKNKQTSEALAAYLNLDFVEQLASRRATGGTRPALDYTALLSIPVIEDVRIVALMQLAYAEKKKLEKEAADLLAQVDSVLLKNLGITLPKPGSGALSERVFHTKLAQLSGNIFDPKTHSPRSLDLMAALRISSYPQLPLRDVITHRMAGDWGEDEDWLDDADFYTKCLVIRGTEFDNEINLRVTNGREKYRKIPSEKLARMKVEAGDLLIEKSGGSPDQPVGRVAILDTELLNSKSICYSNFVEKIKPDTNQVLSLFLFHYLRFVHSIGVTDLLQSQTNGIRNLMIHRYLALPVSLPPMKVQADIVAEIQALQGQAIQLRQQAQKKLDTAKAQVERMIFGAS